MTNILDAIRCADENMHAAHPPSGGADGCLSPLTVAEIGGRENGYSADKGVDEPLRRAAPHGITVPARFQQRQRAASVVSGAQRASGALRVHTEPEPPGGPPLGARLRPAGPRTLRLTWSPPPPQSLTHGRIQATYVRLADQITLTRSVRRPELVLLLKHLQPNTAYSLPVAGRRRDGPFPADLDVAELCSLLPVTVYQLLVSAHSAAGTTESTTRLAIHAADGAMISPLPPPEKSVNGRQ
ncbi:hypothetical protein FJT64_009497 [Amphibalanus amphitrite]|uniref:Fibronectin type-III domain-containing protein n=1 Tax=Amphibalanus amphitrite TaxID=1232801 RepID=A0A6A4V8D2_AMPAM|nr:hypothetical protein FJT64_009497 [Amphibalanus amphitrite]